MLSTIRFTSAPNNDFSNSGEYTPSLSGMKRFSLVTAMWIGIRHNRSTIHSPARYCDAFHCLVPHSSWTNAENGFADTLMDLRMPPVGFLDVRSKWWIMRVKYGANLSKSRSVINTRLLAILRLAEELYVSIHRCCGRTSRAEK